MTESTLKLLTRLFCFFSLLVLLALFFEEAIFPLRIAAIFFLAAAILMIHIRKACIPVLIIPILLALIELGRTSGEHLIGPLILILLSSSLITLQLPLADKRRLLVSNAFSAIAFSLAFLVCTANITQLEKSIGVENFSYVTLPMGIAYLFLSLATIALAEEKVGNRLLPFLGAPLILSIFIVGANSRMWWVFLWSGYLQKQAGFSEALHNVHLTILITSVQVSLLFILSLFFLGKRRQKSFEFEAVLNASDEAIFALNRVGKVYYLNHAALRFLNLAERVAGKPLQTLLHGEELDKRTEEPLSARFNDVIHLPNGDNCFCQFKIESVSNGEKVVLLHDITERVQSEEQLRSLLRDLGRTNRQLAEAKEKESARAKASGEFLAMLSHEIRNPLSSMISISSLLDRTTLTNEQQHFLSLIKRSEEQLLKLVNDVLDFSKIEEGYITLHEERFSLAELLQEVVEGFLPLAGQKKLALSLHVDSKLPPEVIGDRHRLRQILLNFLGNALKFTAKGSITLSASLVSEEGNSVTVNFSVSDTGAGIAPEKQKQLFSRFSQGDASIAWQYGGTGLGLSIAKELTEMMHGRVGVHSTPGKGSTFWAEIPFASG